MTSFPAASNALAAIGEVKEATKSAKAELRALEKEAQQTLRKTGEITNAQARGIASAQNRVTSLSDHLDRDSGQEFFNDAKRNKRALKRGLHTAEQDFENIRTILGSTSASEAGLAATRTVLDRHNLHYLQEAAEKSGMKGVAGVLLKVGKMLPVLQIAVQAGMHAHDEVKGDIKFSNDLSAMTAKRQISAALERDARKRFEEFSWSGGGYDAGNKRVQETVSVAETMGHLSHDELAAAVQGSRKTHMGMWGNVEGQQTSNEIATNVQNSMATRQNAEEKRLGRTLTEKERALVQQSAFVDAKIDEKQLGDMAEGAKKMNDAQLARANDTPDGAAMFSQRAQAQVDAFNHSRHQMPALIGD